MKTLVGQRPLYLHFCSSWFFVKKYQDEAASAPAGAEAAVPRGNVRP
jgi:hypothetical protein